MCVLYLLWLCRESLRTGRVRHPARGPDICLDPEQEQGVHVRSGQQKVPPWRPEKAGVISHSQVIIHMSCVLLGHALFVYQCLFSEKRYTVSVLVVLVSIWYLRLVPIKI